MAVDNTNPLAFGFEKKVDVFFDNSPVMELAPNASLRGVKTGGVVRLARSRCAPAGRGASTISKAAPPRVEAHARQGQGVPVRTGDHLPRAAARHVQVPVQQDLLRHLGAPGRAGDDDDDAQ